MLTAIQCQERGNATHLYSFVPASCSKNPTLRRLYPLNDLDGRVVLSDLLRLARRDIVHTTCVVSATGEDFATVLDGGKRSLHASICVDGGRHGLCSSIRSVRALGECTLPSLVSVHLHRLRR